MTQIFFSCNKKGKKGGGSLEGKGEAVRILIIHFLRLDTLDLKL